MAPAPLTRPGCRLPSRQNRQNDGRWGSEGKKGGGKRCTSTETQNRMKKKPELQQTGQIEKKIRRKGDGVKGNEKKERRERDGEKEKERKKRRSCQGENKANKKINNTKKAEREKCKIFKVVKIAQPTLTKIEM